MEKKKRWPLLLAISAVLVLVAGTASFFILNLFGSRSPDQPSIAILQPQSPPTIQNDQGIHFIVLARSEVGIHRIEFFENNLPRGESLSPEPGQPELVSQGTWLPDGTGIFTLKWVAYDMQNTASDPVSMTVGVVSPGLSGADAKDIHSGVDSSDVVLVAGSDFIDPQGDSDAQPELILGGELIQQPPQGEGNESQGLVHEPGQDVGLPVQDDQAGAEGAEGEENRPQVSDFPPEIVSFETHLQREGDGVRLNVDAAAEDDVGVETIFIVDYQEGDQAMPIQLAHPCGGQASCSASASAVLGPGVHDIIAGAQDTIGQDARTYWKNIEISENLEVDEGPAVIERADPEQIPFDFIQSIAQQEGSILHMHTFAPFEVIGGQEGIDANDTSCDPHSIRDVQIEIEQFWHEDHTPSFRLDCFYPCQVQADSDDATLCVEVDEIGLNCSYEDWDMLCRAHILWIQEEPYSVYDMRFMYGPDRPWTRELCGMGNVTFTPAISVENEIVQRGTPLEVEILPCPPMGVDVQVIATENCPEGSPEEDYCLWVNVVPKQPRVVRDRLGIDHFYIKETIYVSRSPIVNEYNQPANEYNLVFNNPHRGYLHEYEVYAVSAEGIRSEKSLVNIRVPALGNNAYRSSNHWEENR